MKLKTLSAIAATAAALVVAAPASALTYTFSADLSGTAESPPNASPAYGTAVVTFDDVANTVQVFELFAGLTGGPASASHIHCCTSLPNTGTSGVYLGFTGFPSVMTGFYSNTFTLSAASFATLLAGTQAGMAYVNIHNGTFPGGEIRGFLQGAVVPEPASGALMFGGLAALGWIARRKRTV